MGKVRTINEARDRQRSQNGWVRFALSSSGQNGTGHLGLDRGCAFGFGKRRCGVVKDSPHQLDEIGWKDNSARIHVWTLHEGEPCPAQI